MSRYAGNAQEELLDVVDEAGEPTGEVVPRSRAHEEGIPHRTAHVWLVRERDGHPEVLLQRRAANKSHPLCLDVSSAGHIPAGVGYLDSALRELAEELGVRATADELVYCGHRRTHFEGSFFGRPFRDSQYVRVYLIHRDVEEDDLTLQESEVAGVLWMDLDACRKAVEEDAIKHCIAPIELAMVAATLEGRADAGA
jgi:isopentenyldiphosphate isomerase